MSDSAMLWVIDSQVPPSMGFSRQEYWSGLPFSSPGNLPKSGIKLRAPASQAGSLLSEPPVNPKGSPRGGLVLGYNSQSRVPQERRLKPDPSWKPHPPPVRPIPCSDSRTLLQVPPEAHSPSTTGTGIPVASSTQRNSFLRHLPDAQRDGIQKLWRWDIIWHRKIREERHHMASLTCGIGKEMIQMNLLTKQKETHRLREWTYGCWARRDN